MGMASDRILTAWARPEHMIAPRIGTPGYTLPDISNHEWHRVGPNLRMPSVVYEGPEDAKDNWLVLPPNYRWVGRTRLEVSGKANGNVVVYADGAQVAARIPLRCMDGLVVFGGNSPHSSAFDVILGSDNQTVFIGHGCSSNGTGIHLGGSGSRVVIGDDCMFASEIKVRTSDHHGIMDLDTGRWMNRPSDIHFEPHVWVGERALVYKGVTVGLGAIVAAGSKVTRSVPRFSLCGGAPSAILRNNTTWDRHEEPRPHTLNELRALEAQLPVYVP